LCYSKNPLKDIEAELTSAQIDEYKNKDEKYPIRGGYVTQPLYDKKASTIEKTSSIPLYITELQLSLANNGLEETRLLEAIKNKKL